MITSNRIKEIVFNHIDGSELFIVDIVVRSGNNITVHIDSNKGVSIDECAGISKIIDSNFNREEEDFELEVSSPGLTQPFKVVQQYIKNIGQNVEVLLKNGQKETGKLISANAETFTIEKLQKVKLDVKSKPEMVATQQQFKLEDVKSTKVVINF